MASRQESFPLDTKFLNDANLSSPVGSSLLATAALMQHDRCAIVGPPWRFTP